MQPQTSAPTNESTTSSPRDVVHRYFTALNNADAGAISDLFADDGVMMADGFPSANGKAEIRISFEGAFAMMRMQRQVEVDDVTEDGALAMVRAHSTGTVMLLGPGSTMEQTNRELYVLRRGSDGWRIGAYMFNSPTR